MARIRTIPQALKEIKEADPGTAITYNSLRRWVNSGTIPHVKAGNTALIDLDLVFEIIRGGGSGGN